MELSDKTKIDDLLKQHPYLLDFLITLSPMLSDLKNPEMRKTLGKIATLSEVSAIGGIDLDTLMSAIAAEIEQTSRYAEHKTIVRHKVMAPQPKQGLILGPGGRHEQASHRPGRGIGRQQRFGRWGLDGAGRPHVQLSTGKKIQLIGPGIIAYQIALDRARDIH